jgi:hypothetical protein
LSVLESAALIGRQRPGLLHLPDGTAATAEDALYLLGEWGFGYDEWQEFTMRSALLEQPDGRWAAKEFGLEIPRQNGKGEEIEGRECLGLFYLDERKLIHSAHEFATASEALDRMDDRIGQNPVLKRRVKSVKRSHGEEGVYLRDGRKLLYKTRTKGGGRGFSADLLILDEAMFIAESFLGALMPVISARPNPQMWYTGSAVDQETMEHGIVFARLRERALAGNPGRMAYLGWSPAYERRPDGALRWESPVDVPREATADLDVIAQANPSLGIRIDLEHVVETERAAICAAGRRADGLAHVEVVEHERGTGWVVPRLKELADRHEPAAIVFAGKSGAAALAPALEAAGVYADPVSSPEEAEACGLFFDAVDQGTLRHLGTSEMLTALKGAAQRHLGDASWAWSRKSSAVDITPLVACTLAHWSCVNQPDMEPFFVWSAR